jgi:hypothetical protein
MPGHGVNVRLRDPSGPETDANVVDTIPDMAGSADMRLEFKVIRPFTAVAPISDAQQLFAAGEIVVCDTAQSGSTLTFELGRAYTLFFLVERSVFDAGCEHIARTPGRIESRRSNNPGQTNHWTHSTDWKLQRHQGPPRLLDVAPARIHSTRLPLAPRCAISSAVTSARALFSVS